MKKFLSSIKKVKIRHLVLVVLLLMANVYAWFIYSTKVNVGLGAHIATWDIEFMSDKGEVATNMPFIVDRVIPGMDEVSQTLIVTNSGNTPANLIYEITSMKILGEEFVLGEGVTSEVLSNKLQNDYPFKFTFEMTNPQVTANGGREEFTVSLNWPYESGDDALDTLWGQRAYEFYALNPDGKSIEINMTVSAVQDDDSIIVVN